MTVGTAPPKRAFDATRVREEFPILTRRVRGRPLAYLDNASTAQKPRAVLRAIERFYAAENSNVHRGVHWLSQEATTAYGMVRAEAATFLGAAEPEEIIFAHGTTSAINLIARSYGDEAVRAGDEVVVTQMEHHSNFVPWQALCERAGATLRVAPIDDSGELILEEFERLLSPKTRIVALAHVSNVLGTVNPIARIAEMAHRQGAVVVVDGAQSAPHFPIDVQALGVDFFALSGHKMFGPMGIGLLWGRRRLLDAMPPYEFGGGMVGVVSAEKTTYAPGPSRFEAGTPPVAQVIGMGAAIGFLRNLPPEGLQAHEHDLLGYATERIGEIPGVRVIGTAANKLSVLSFVMEGVHPHDIGTVLDARGVAIRAGHHCAQPLMTRYGIAATARASFALYNTREDAEALVDGLRDVRRVFG